MFVWLFVYFACVVCLFVIRLKVLWIACVVGPLACLCVASFVWLCVCMFECLVACLFVCVFVYACLCGCLLVCVWLFVCSCC